MNANTTHIARRLLTCAAIVGALTVGAAGITTAESHSRPSDPRNGTGDSTGWNHIDPMGQHHQNRDRLDANAADQARRDYRRQSQPGSSDTATNGNSNSSSWSRVTRPDGSGYTVCRPQASWCK
ncbi:hypothetical protein OHA40_08320 [Nocardia sp. NBC_00508]|uniref:hypothetical protein n=1 Tax=Nocardia sp. NBC_00508 TaxID=2975992 RepID=UPI002E8214D4|nr:hypothetical protein [Nocardia sp. NBC_00508]WUD68107.1 hypothetical protein OHA40_08320 [Nocardia sp. NBC_00508]